MVDNSPRKVVERFIEASARGAYDELVDFYAEDVVIEIPFAPPGFPRVSDGGREEFRARTKTIEGLWTIDGIDPVRIHETADPEVVIAEFTMHRTVTATGKPMSGDYIMVITVRDGLIAHSRDYANPMASAVAFGRLQELVDAYESQ
ncbi:nuclear transport factor 2 family protein [Fodinicola feengrottensis]|uniref:Nuclear transport factor 2 family protein n=1 Tax=Fodinicola feengrottensis TaxID=435914 RepID=A0ABN2H6U1_9ACTN|nr:nuclear transport factor 2 family protein [Fodinicola feengrottensis]